MSTVYRAFDPTLERWVAIKLMHRDISSDPDQLERFRREARAVAQLNHPHVVTVIDSGEDDGAPLHRLRVRRGRDAQGAHQARWAGCRSSEAVAYAIEIGRALECAHANRLVHRDVKPQNVLIDARRARQGHRLRHRPLARGAGPDRHRARARHHRLRLARAGARPGGRPRSPTSTRSASALRDAHRRGAVQGGDARWRWR